MGTARLVSAEGQSRQSLARPAISLVTSGPLPAGPEIGRHYISIAKLDTERFVCLLCLSSFKTSVKLDNPLTTRHARSFSCFDRLDGFCDLIPRPSNNGGLPCLG
jgi:hypothetical protein